MTWRWPTKSGDASTFRGRGARSLRRFDGGIDVFASLDAVDRERNTVRVRGIFQRLKPRVPRRSSIGEGSHAACGRKEIDEDFLALAVELGCEDADAGDIAVGMGQGAHQAFAYHIVGRGDDGNSRCRGLHGTDRSGPAAQDGIGSGLDPLLHDGGELLIAAVETAAIDYEILAFHETLLAQLVEKRGHHARWQWS